LSFRQLVDRRFSLKFLNGANIKRDENGYEIKEKDWFNGLSLDPGPSVMTQVSEFFSELSF